MKKVVIIIVSFFAGTCVQAQSTNNVDTIWGKPKTVSTGTRLVKKVEQQKEVQATAFGDFSFNTEQLDQRVAQTTTATTAQTVVVQQPIVVPQPILYPNPYYVWNPWFQNTGVCLPSLLWAFLR